MGFDKSARLVLSFLVLTTIVAIFARSVGGFHPTYPYSDQLAVTSSWIAVFAQFDGVHYLTIARQGYVGTGLIQAFFPVYPLLMWLVTLGGSSDQALIIAGRLVSVLSLLGVLWLWYKQGDLVEKKSLKWSLWILLLWPTSFFLESMYTESLFLLLVIATFVLARKKQWLLAAIIAGIASGTRIVGVFLFPALIIELALQTNFEWQNIPKWLITNWKKLSILSLSLLGWLLYSLYLSFEFGDPLLYFHVQQEFGGGRQESIVLLPQVLYRSVRQLLSIPLSDRWMVTAQEFGLTALAFAVMIWGRKKVRFSLWVFSLAALILPTVTGSLSSMPRYILSAPAVILLIGYFLWRFPKARILALSISAGLLVFNLWLYGQGLWVS